jgi:hypothetical protein
VAPIENRDLSNVYNIEEEEHLKNDKNVEYILYSLSLSHSLTRTHTQNLLATLKRGVQAR